MPGKAIVQHPAPDFDAVAVVNGEFKNVKLSDYKGVPFFSPSTNPLGPISHHMCPSLMGRRGASVEWAVGCVFWRVATSVCNARKYRIKSASLNTNAEEGVLEPPFLPSFFHCNP